MNAWLPQPEDVQTEEVVIEARPLPTETREVAAPAAETVSEAVEAAETVEAAANDTGEDAAPPRKGWWQRTFGD